MSTSNRCPECRKKPVPAGRYLCEACEKALMAAAEPGSGRVKRSQDSKSEGAKFVWPWRRAKDPDVQITEEVAKKLERPRWFQYAVLASLVTLGLLGAWGANVYADSHRHSEDRRVQAVRNTIAGIDQSWRKLDDAMN